MAILKFGQILKAEKCPFLSSFSARFPGPQVSTDVVSSPMRAYIKQKRTFGHLDHADRLKLEPMRANIGLYEIKN